MGVDVGSLTTGLVDVLLRSGRFTRVNAIEPLGPVGQGVVAAVWPDRGGMSSLASGLSASSAVINFKVRLYTQVAQAPDAIDPMILGAADYVIGLLAGDFDLNGKIRNIDLLGAFGTPLGFVTGYVESGGSVSRIVDIDVPMVVNDCWDQGV